MCYTSFTSKKEEEEALKFLGLSMIKILIQAQVSIGGENGLQGGGKGSNRLGDAAAARR
jgi:hypothetical protein